MYAVVLMHASHHICNDHLHAAYDADIVIRVVTVPGRRTLPCSSGAASWGTAVHFEPETGRPIFGEMILCDADPNFFFTGMLQFVVHEMLHNMVRVVVRATALMRSGRPLH